MIVQKDGESQAATLPGGRVGSIAAGCGQRSGEGGGLGQQSRAATSDGSVVLSLVRQPEVQHRARYQTEGSRGAIKDRTGSGYPTVRIDGYSKPTRVQIFIGSEAGRALPHKFYQACRVTGKSPNPCDESISPAGTNIIEVSSQRRNSNLFICDFVGILKVRYSDVEGRFPKDKEWKQEKKKSTKCRLVFRTAVQNLLGETETLQVVSDVINCTQLPGTPEIGRMSRSLGLLEGGQELWIIGKNFLKDTRVVFTFTLPGKEEPTWTKVREPLKEFFHANHLIVTVPPFFDLRSRDDVYVSVYVRCGGKMSDPFSFCYQARPAGLLASPAEPRQTASVIKRTQAFTGGADLVDPAMLAHRTKRVKVEAARRARSTPRPSLLNEDAVLVTDRAAAPAPGTTFSQYTWQGVPKTGAQSGIMKEKSLCILEPKQDAVFTYRRALSNLEPRSLLSGEGRSLPAPTDKVKDSSSVFTNNADFSSNLTSDFTVFQMKSELEGRSGSRTASAVSIIQATGEEETVTVWEAPEAKEAKLAETESASNAVAVETKSNSMATISISLPSSILKDQEHLKNVMETINNTLLKTEEKENATEMERETAAEEIVLSQPVSVLSGSRKRSFCDEEGNTDYDSALGGMNVDYKTSVGEFDSYCEAEQTTTLESSLTKRWNADFNEMLGKVIEGEKTMREESVGAASYGSLFPEPGGKATEANALNLLETIEAQLDMTEPSKNEKQGLMSTPKHD